MGSQVVRWRVVMGGVCILAQCLFSGANVNAASCTGPIKVIFVKGSGQSEGEKEAERLEKELKTRLSTTQFEYHELQNSLPELIGEARYKAVPVAGSVEGIRNGAEAIVSGSQFGEYRASLETGKNLLLKLLVQYKVKGLCSVLAGYSQGAQVIGETVSELSDDVKAGIVYVGLLGDPKLDLDGIDVLPGKNVPWYRGTAIPLIQGGVLGSRKPYLPNYDGRLLIEAGSWCFNDDFICSANYPAAVIAKSVSHSEYPERAIPQMALEIANVINNPSGTFTKDHRPSETCGPAKQDIVVLLDISPMMRREASVFSNTPLYLGAEPKDAMPTAGQMLTRVGCGDTRVAVVGYGRAQDGPPRVLLDFTKSASEYDALLASLYQPSTTGQYERTMFREGALKALEANWRNDAAKTVFAITDIAGSGSAGVNAWRGWDDSRASSAYLKDTVSQQVLREFREHDATLLGVPVTHSYAGFTKATVEDETTDAQRYIKMMSRSTGGYMWLRSVPNYGTYNFKYSLLDATINYPQQIREKTVASVPSIRGEVGKPVTTKVNDVQSYFAAVALRGDIDGFTWHVDCSDLSRALNSNQQEVTFTPTTAGKCKGAVVVRVQKGSGNGCYGTCPEPFPPYLYRSFPFDIDIKPAGYVPKIPSSISNLQKTLYDTRAVYTWDRPAYVGEQEPVYVVRESDGTVLAATTARELIITDTAKTDPVISITAAGEDGVSPPLSSASTPSVDMRTLDISDSTDLPEFVARVEPPSILASSVTSGQIVNILNSGTLSSVPQAQQVTIDMDEANISEPGQPGVVLGSRADTSAISKEAVTATIPARETSGQRGKFMSWLVLAGGVIAAILFIKTLILHKLR